MISISLLCVGGFRPPLVYLPMYMSMTVAMPINDPRNIMLKIASMSLPPKYDYTD